MDSTIYYVYERSSGRFAGSGTPYIDNETHASTEVPVLPNNEYEEWFFDPAAQTWSQLDDHGRRGAGLSGGVAGESGGSLSAAAAGLFE